MSTVGTFVTGHSVLRYGHNLYTNQQGQPHTIQYNTNSTRAHARSYYGRYYNFNPNPNTDPNPNLNLNQF